VLTAERRDAGSIMVLIIGYTTLATVLIIVGVDVSKVFLARRALSAAADSAALAAAQGIDRSAVYGGNGLQCGQPIPLSRGRAADLADQSVRGDAGDLRRTFRSLDDPQIAVAGGTVTVRLSGEVAVPFGRVLTWLDPSRKDDNVHVGETSSAESPVSGGAC
jgi:hypothetical protein